MVGMANIVFEALEAGLLVLWEYLSEHTLTCLVPAFFIAGAIAVFIKKDAVLRYLGPMVPKRVSYPIAGVSGTVLAVCSCTILPLFAGIYRKGAGIGPASAFLYSGPAINIMAIAFTASALGYELGLARALAAIALSFVVGLSMAMLFKREEVVRAEELRSREATAGGALEDGDGRPGWVTMLIFVLLVAILIVGTAAIDWRLKLVLILSLLALTVYLVWSRVTEDEREDWAWETWDLTKKILPALLIGAFIVGVIGYFIPPETFAPYLGNNSLAAVFLAAIIGGILYMPTLLEVPIVGDLLGYNEGTMAAGPALALLLAGPAVSLPNMIVLYRLVGWRKTMAYIVLVIIASTFAGFIYGNVVS
jgi:uncharacterized membrane protein YraQ (UPF0718 family)